MTTVHWLDGDGNWNTASDWSGRAVPGSSDDALNDAGGAYTVTSSQTNTVKASALWQVLRLP
jgi:hypothetical protein